MNRVDDLVVAVHGRVRTMGGVLDPVSPEARFVKSLDESLERWSAERRDRTAAPAQDGAKANATLADEAEEG